MMSFSSRSTSSVTSLLCSRALSSTLDRVICQMMKPASTSSRSTGRNRVCRRMRLNSRRFTQSPPVDMARPVNQHLTNPCQKLHRPLALQYCEIHHLNNFGGEIDVCGEKQDRNIRPLPAHRGGHLATIHPRHEVVQNHASHRLIDEQIESRGAVQGSQHPVTGAFQHGFADLKAERFVIDT